MSCVRIWDFILDTAQCVIVDLLVTLVNRDVCELNDLVYVVECNIYATILCDIILREDIHHSSYAIYSFESFNNGVTSVE